MDSTLLTYTPYMINSHRLLVNCYRDETTQNIAEEFTIPGKDYPISQYDEMGEVSETTDNTVKITRIITLVLAVLGLILFILTLIRFIRRIQSTFS